jgi:hypothetical protein
MIGVDVGIGMGIENEVLRFEVFMAPVCVVYVVW